MKTKLQKRLATLAPSISITTHWEPDQCSGPISRECDGFDKSEDDEWEAWQSEVRANAIIGGEELSGSAYLGGTFEKAGDNPAISNPNISDYERGMTSEAVTELLLRIETTPGIGDYVARDMVIGQIGDVLRYLETPRAASA